jgi:hypothetical protein
MGKPGKIVALDLAKTLNRNMRFARDFLKGQAALLPNGGKLCSE